MRLSIPRIAMISTHGYVAASPELGRPDTGGQVVYVLELSKALARMGYEVDILTRQFEDQPDVEDVAAGVRLLRHPCGGDGFIPKETLCEQIPEWAANASRRIRQEGVEYAFINTHYWDAGLAGKLLAERFGFVHLHTPHSLGVWKRDNTPGDAFENERMFNFARRIRDERTIYASCAQVLATTRSQQEVLAGDEYAVPLSKILVAPPGYDDTRFFPVSAATRGALKRELDLEGPVVLALGRIASNKGYDLLVQAMAPVAKRLPAAKLVLAIGATQPTPEEQEQVELLQKLAVELEIADQVVFRNYIPDEQLADYYRAADVFALSSRYEPFGMTAVEAMACGTPVVMTTAGGLWEQITWGLDALYADPNDPEAFGHSLLEILQYPEVAAQLAENGAQKARSLFTWTGVCQQILRAIEGASVQHDRSALNNNATLALSAAPRDGS